MNIPFSPPFIDQSVIDQVLETLKNNWITTGPKVKALEDEVRMLTGSDAVVCVNSWTSGAMLMMKWFGIKPGDEVIVPAYTYCATALSVLHCGAIPVMVDVLDDFNIDPEKVKAAITTKTKAIISVDIAGWPCDFNALREIVNDQAVMKMFKPESTKQTMLNRILLISDAAHSIGSTYCGKPAAVNCDLTIFSFHAVKNITTAEGGAICLNLPQQFNPEEEYKYLKMYTLNGQNKDALAKSRGGGWRYDILFPGLKINMPDICAAIGLAQIKKYNNSLLPQRKHVAEMYCKGFEDKDWFILPPLKNTDRETCYHLFPLRVKGLTEAQRDQVIDDLAALGVAANVHFIPMPMLTYFKELGYDIANYPRAFENYVHEISLPIYPQLTQNEIEFIISSVINCVEILLNQVSDLGEEVYVKPLIQMAVAS
ncbi:DegT/DnrJ/EryC1/StrS family aminotransferase [Pedobacter sandarakinus]|uniref:DegT/DnrJ/EryC1/StrS family aminotransferase n=1 Tax=Pedobacter sandarakinus TaxID=353156 RepID=UPI002245E35E|nr:DegT/DnrJ/EryC1/StrS family aminotransferase [Pedobacter sandarakinus]MCX2574301.1 DegT/DnrJ/EryC1/StrS family aminotransferase [Pedobacter sandarakinus]